MLVFCSVIAPLPPSPIYAATFLLPLPRRFHERNLQPNSEQQKSARKRFVLKGLLSACGEMKPSQIAGNFRAVFGAGTACSGVKERAVSCGSIDSIGAEQLGLSGLRQFGTSEICMQNTERLRQSPGASPARPTTRAPHLLPSLNRTCPDFPPSVFMLSVIVASAPKAFLASPFRLLFPDSARVSGSRLVPLTISTEAE
jgi:hypothetical protein